MLEKEVVVRTRTAPFITRPLIDSFRACHVYRYPYEYTGALTGPVPGDEDDYRNYAVLEELNGERWIAGIILDESENMIYIKATDYFEEDEHAIYEAAHSSTNYRVRWWSAAEGYVKLLSINESGEKVKKKLWFH